MSSRGHVDSGLQLLDKRGQPESLKEIRETKKVPVVQGVQGHLLWSYILEREGW